MFSGTPILTAYLKAYKKMKCRSKLILSALTDTLISYPKIAPGIMRKAVSREPIQSCISGLLIAQNKGKQHNARRGIGTILI
jgi:hypothetical protein